MKLSNPHNHQISCHHKRKIDGVLRSILAARQLVYFFMILMCMGYSTQMLGASTIQTELILQLRNNNQIQDILRQSATSPAIVSPLSKSMNIWLLNFSSSAEATASLTTLKTNKSVVAVQYNHHLNYRSYTPTDSFYNQQWYLNNTGQYGYVPGTDIDAAAAWDTTLGGTTRYGDSIVVAVVDGKFNLNHRDLNFFKNYTEIPANGIDDDGDTYIDNYNGWSAHTHNDDVNLASAGHATQISGIIGAKHDNKGIAGINNGIKILPIYAQAIESEVVEAYGYIIDARKTYDLSGGTKGAFIVASNSSFGIDMAYPVDFPIWCAMYDSMGKYGIVSTAATANAATDVDIFGDMPTACASNFLITVTNLTGANTLSFSAGYGDSTIDIAAPGVNIMSCIGSDGYAPSNGTSFSSPMVAGAVALLMSHACVNFLDLYNVFPDSAATLLKKYIVEGATLVPDLAGKVKTAGRLDLFNAIVQLNNFDCSACLGNINYAIQNSFCDNKNTGSIHTSVTPSNTNLHYVWSTGDTTANIDSLAAGSYTLTITDSMGCSRIKRFNIQSPTALIIDSIAIYPYNTSTPGSIYIKGSGGIAPYEYSIDGISFHASTYYSGLGAGYYDVFIKDANGCMVDTTVVIDNNTAITNINSDKSFALYNSLSKDDIILVVRQNSLTANHLHYLISDLQGRSYNVQNIDIKGLEVFQQKIDITLLSKGLYLLTIFNEKEKLKTFKFSKY